MADKHTVRSYDDDLNTLTLAVLRMGGLAESQFADATQALLTHNTDLARTVIDSDQRIDALESEVNDSAIRLLALRQPMADDLRYVVSAFKISANLERIGDYAANIGKRALVLESLDETPLINLIEPMVVAARHILRETLDAYAAQDLDRAMEAWSRDKPLDKLYETLLRDLSSAMMDNPALVCEGSHLMFIARNIERIGDHAKNIAENIYFFVSGLPLSMAHPRDRGEDDETP